MRKGKKNSGQAIVEYIIIIVIVAVAALGIMGIFSDRIRAIIGGVAATFGANDTARTENSTEVLKKIGGEDGSEAWGN